MSVPGYLLQAGQNASGALNQILGGLLGNSGAPYQAAGNEYQNWMNKGIGAYNPYYNAGVDSIGKYQNALNGMSNPSQFINNLMNQYQQSPYNRYLQNQGQRAVNNAASASGLLGSTPYQQQGIQTSQNIAQQGMNDWLNQVLGINTQYLGGEQNLMNQGFNAAQGIGGLYGQGAQYLGDAAYGQQAGENQDRANLWGGVEHLLFGGG